MKDIHEQPFEYLKLCPALVLLALLVAWCAHERARHRNASAPVITKGGLVVDDGELGRLNQ
jgi:hypothetical protein